MTVAVKEMAGDINLYLDKPVSSLSFEARDLLNLLDSKKIFLTDGPEKLCRDWRGLATLIGISSQIASNISENIRKTQNIIELWVKKADGTATIAVLLKYLQRIDRYDIIDDLKPLAETGRLIAPVATYSTTQSLLTTESNLVTYDDHIHGAPVQYHAYVLYADVDRDFVMKIVVFLRDKGFLICTVDDIAPGAASQYATVAQLISQQCRRIVLVYSPEFLQSSANTFYTNYAQADGIQKKQTKIIPIMYRQCELPTNLAHYHMLYYSTPEAARPFYDFWEQLTKTFDTIGLPKKSDVLLPTPQLQLNDISLRELEPVEKPNGIKPNQHNLVSISSTLKSFSMSGLDSLKVANLQAESKSLSGESQTSEKKKKKGLSKLFHNPFKGKKKKALMVETAG